MRLYSFHTKSCIGEIHFVKENEILSKDSRSAEKFVHEIKLVMAKNYIDNLSEEVKKGLRTKAAQNLWPSFAPLGYMNTVGPDGKRIIVPDPVYGPMVTELFEWFASGEYSLKGLAQKAYGGRAKYGSACKKSWMAVTRRSTARSPTTSPTRDWSIAVTAGAPWLVKSRRAATCTTTVRGIAGSARSRIHAKKS